MSKTTTYSLSVATLLVVSIVIPAFADTADFVDPDKDPTYYLDRYYSEPTYKSWFDKNYPEYTIEEAVGITSESKSTIQTIMEQEIIPEAEAKLAVSDNTTNSDNGDFAQLALAVGGLGILFGAVLGIKRKVDDNSKQISVNTESIKQRLLGTIKGTKPIEILQSRLAKGEITIEEFNKLKKKINQETN